MPENYSLELALENDYIKVVCLPEHGGKLSSIFYKHRNFEFLFQNPYNSYRKAESDANFQDYEACGFDDAFPSIDREDVVVNGKTVRYPDHGEIWSSEMEAEPGENEIRLSFISGILPYRYRKRIRIENSRVMLNYHIENTGDYAFPAFWTMHCLARIESGMRIFLPENTDTVLNVLDSHTSPLGEKGSTHPYPMSGNYDLSLVQSEKDQGTCSKFYIPHRLADSSCGYIYPESRLAIRIESKLPYLGFWKTVGGFRGDHNCALEPSFGFYDNIATAKKNNACPVIHPGECLDFDIRISFTEYKETR